MTREHYDILYHTAHRAAGGLYCGGGPVMADLVARGLMASAGRKSFVPDEYFRLTSEGRKVLSGWQAAQPKPKLVKSKQSRAFRAWREYRDHTGGCSFQEFLRTRWKQLKDDWRTA